MKLPQSLLLLLGAGTSLVAEGCSTHGTAPDVAASSVVESRDESPARASESPIARTPRVTPSPALTAPPAVTTSPSPFLRTGGNPPTSNPIASPADAPDGGTPPKPIPKPQPKPQPHPDPCPPCGMG